MRESVGIYTFKILFHSFFFLTVNMEDMKKIMNSMENDDVPWVQFELTKNKQTVGHYSTSSLCNDLNSPTTCNNEVEITPNLNFVNESQIFSKISDTSPRQENVDNDYEFIFQLNEIKSIGITMHNNTNFIFSGLFLTHKQVCNRKNKSNDTEKKAFFNLASYGNARLFNHFKQSLIRNNNI